VGVIRRREANVALEHGSFDPRLVISIGNEAENSNILLYNH
jgi:hypothetical protein